MWWRESSRAGRCSGDERTVRGKEGSGAPLHRGETETRKPWESRQGRLAGSPAPGSR